MKGRQRTARQIFATNVRRIRKSRGWSQECLAEEAGLHHTFVGAVERAERNVSLENVERIARALRISVSELLDDRVGAGGDR